MATFPKYNTKFVERDKIDTPNTQNLTFLVLHMHLN